MKRVNTRTSIFQSNESLNSKTMATTRLQPDKAIDFILGGRALLTVHNTQPKKVSESQFTYSIKQKIDKNTRQRFDVWYVYVVHDYIGCIKNQQFIPTDNPKYVLLRPKETEVFGWLWRRLIAGKLEDFIHLYYSGHCSVCGRIISEVSSLSRGIGPYCFGKR